MDRPIRLIHSGLSDAEREALYNLLMEPFGVVEESANNSNMQEGMLSSIYIELPTRYEGFIKVLGLDRWEGLKEMIKNMRWRRGKSTFLLTLHFSEENHIIFTIKSNSNRVFNKAIDGIEYVADTVYFKDVKNARYVKFEFDVDDMKWYPIQVSRL